MGAESWGGAAGGMIALVVMEVGLGCVVVEDDSTGGAEGAFAGCDDG